MGEGTVIVAKKMLGVNLLKSRGSRIQTDATRRPLAQLRWVKIRLCPVGTGKPILILNSSVPMGRGRLWEAMPLRLHNFGNRVLAEIHSSILALLRRMAL